jgi:hypothetical protein
MPSFESNPFAVLTFIVAPAILTNASSVMSLGTSNRLARAMERARALSAQVEGKEGSDDPEISLRVLQIQYAETRALMLVRALTAFYASVGSFAAASLISLIGAVFFVARWEVARDVSLWLALAAGVVGVGGLVCGNGLLVAETRFALRMLSEEIKQRLSHPHRRPRYTPPA